MRFSALFAAFVLSVGFVGSAAAQQTRWVGAYVCDQGVQGMTLTVTQLPDQQLSAVFEFYPSPANPDVGTGSFAMQGRAEGRSINLSAQRWINAPPDYNMVDFRGEIAANAQSLIGAIYTQGGTVEGCTAAALVRAP